MGHARKYGVGERVAYAHEWPGLPNAAYTIPAGALGTVVSIPDGPSSIYVVRLDEALPNFASEMSCLESALVPA